MLASMLDSDIPDFLSMARKEGWVTAAWEFEFLLRQYPAGCLAWRENGMSLGYVTALKHDKSGWIGNLLVDYQARRRGIGKRLMKGALDALLAGGVETCWLTASAQGEGLYRELGFVPIDSINRWVGEGGFGKVLLGLGPSDREAIGQVDRAGWGDRRIALLEITSSRGRTFCGNHSFLCCQPWEDGTQLGPWGSLLEAQAEPLLDLALSGIEGRVFLDVPAGNLKAASLLSQRGFSIRGTNILMYLGERPLYEPSKVYALASMGSMG